MEISSETPYDDLLKEKMSEMLKFYQNHKNKKIEDDEDIVRLLASLVYKWAHDEDHVCYTTVSDSKRAVWREKLFKLYYNNIKYEDDLTYEKLNHLVNDTFEFHNQSFGKNFIWENYYNKEEVKRNENYIEIDEFIVIDKKFKHDFSKPNKEDEATIDNSNKLIDALIENYEKRFKNDNERMMLSHAVAARFLSHHLKNFKNFNKDLIKLTGFFYCIAKKYEIFKSFYHYINTYCLTSYDTKWCKDEYDGIKFAKLSDKEVIYLDEFRYI